ncbi:hypothetical protein GCM10018781_46990 [Kitasatospora indigofera]|uniref:Uncharacterized protein n=1 Tax=Kitasatospora indigofera TaxID=67307 RepID=A0A919G152_9ACTN|nr:hypothetical protein [Kitasatospora indigofera]GHH76208.1 hypothetical protein GCM10018781_46990 [Kitasatospora indigofera]
MTARMQAWAGGVVGGAAVVGLVVHLGAVGLDRADKWASVLGLFVAIAGLGLTLAGLRRGRAESAGRSRGEAPAGGGPSGQSEQSGQSVDASGVGGGIAQVSGTRGSVRIVHRGPAVPAPEAPAGEAPTPDDPVGPAQGDGPAPDRQRVRGTTTTGPLAQVRGTGGDVEIEAGP